MHPIPLDIYRHYKGNQYEVIGFAKHSEPLKIWLFTDPFTVRVVLGFALLQCGVNLLRLTART